MSEEGWQVYCQPFKYEECYIIKVCAGKFGGDDDSCKGKVNGLNMAGEETDTNGVNVFLIRPD